MTTLCRPPIPDFIQFDQVFTEFSCGLASGNEWNVLNPKNKKIEMKFVSTWLNFSMENVRMWAPFPYFFPQQNKLAALWRRRWNAALYLDDSGVLTRPTGRPPRADYSGVDACDLLSAPFLTCFSLSGPSDYVRCSMCCNFEFQHFFLKNRRSILYEISCHVTRSHQWTSSQIVKWFIRI